MWLPTPLYERLPLGWGLCGALFITLGLYIGFHYEWIYFYLSVGVFCLVRAVWVYRLRRHHRDQGDSNQESELDNPGTASPGH